MASEPIPINEETALAKVALESLSLYDRVKALVVKDQRSYDLATELYKAALAVEKMADAAHDPVVSHWHDLHARACAAKKIDKERSTQAKVLAKSKAATWQDEQERIRQELERKAREEAERKQREDERIALEEAKRILDEAAKAEEEARLRLAAEAEAAGATADQVDEILDTPVFVEPEPAPYVPPAYIPPVVAPTMQKATGFSVRWNYSAVGAQPNPIENLAALVRAAVANNYLLTYLQPNETEINALARRTKDAFSLPGFKLKKERV